MPSTTPAAHHNGGTAAIATPADTGSGSVVPVAPRVETPAETPAAPAEPAPKKHPTLGGKKVVLEYDTPTHETPKSTAAAPEEDSAVAKARAAYAAGNKRLFAGDPEGAVKAYQQALADYPGYVASYRGLGLAYTQTGDKLKAMSAFHLYLSAVPGAKDAPLIKKRLTRAVALMLTRAGSALPVRDTDPPAVARARCVHDHRMKWLVLVVALAACSKSDAKQNPAPKHEDRNDPGRSRTALEART